MFKKLLIKDYKNTSDPAVRTRYGTVAGTFGIVTNIILCALKALVGVFAGSIAIIADAVNNLTDAGSSVMTLVGFKLASRPADKKHPYGHARYESVTALIVAITVFAVGVLLLKSSVEKIITPEKVTVTVWTFVVLGLAVMMKIFQMITYLDFAKAIDSDVIRAQAVDARNDIISSSATLAAMIVIYFTGVNVDAYVGIAVSIFVMVTSVKMISNPISALLGVVPSKETVENLKSIILSRKEILGLHDMIIHDYGEGHRFASVHAEVDAGSELVAVHNVIDGIEREVAAKTGINLSIHLDPVDLKSGERQTYRALTEKAVMSFDNEAKIHDFSVCDEVRENEKTVTKISFDVVEPFGKHYDKEKLKEELYKVFASFGEEKNKKFRFIINIDDDYCQ